MSDDVPEKPHGFLYKATKLALGVASVAALVINFIPGVDLMGISAIIQGGITLVETAMDWKEKGAKKAMWTLGIGALMTGAYLIPFVGGLAKLGEGAVKTGEVAGEATGFLPKLLKPFKVAGKWIGEQIMKIPGAKWLAEKFGIHVTKPLVEQEGKLANWAKGKSWLKKPTQYLTANKNVAQGLEVGAGVTSGVLGYVNDVPPGSMANPDTYDLSEQEQNRQWRDYVSRREQERQAMMAASAARS